MRKQDLFYRLVVLSLFGMACLWARVGLAKGCQKIPVEFTGVTVVRAEIATLKAEPGAIHVCMPDFKTDTEKLSKEELLAKGFVVGRMVLAENAALGGLTLARGTEISFPDIFAHDDEDFQIVSGGVRKIGGLKLIATSSLPISIDAYEREKDAWKLREDRLLKISGHLADHATVSTLPLLAAHPISAIGGVDAVKTDQIDKLRLLLGTLASQAHFKTENADIRLDMKDTVVFTEKQVDDSWVQVYPVGVQWLRVDGQRVEAHALLTYSETTGDVLSFVPATAFKSNGMEIDAWPAKGPGLRSPPVTLYPGGKLASALSSKSQTVQGVKVDRTWNPIYFWDNGKLLHVAETGDPAFKDFTWNGKKVTSFRVSISFDPNGKLRLVYCSQCKVEGTMSEFSGLFEVIKGSYVKVVPDSPMLKWYDWRGYNAEIRDYLKKAAAAD